MKLKCADLHPVCFQIFIHQRLSQWVLTESNTSPLTLSHWAVRETLLSGESAGFCFLTSCHSVLTGEQWMDQHVMFRRSSPVMQCTGVSLDQHSATQSTSLDTVSGNMFGFLFLAWLSSLDWFETHAEVEDGFRWSTGCQSRMKQTSNMLGSYVMKMNVDVSRWWWASPAESCPSCDWGTFCYSWLQVEDRKSSF